MKPAVSQFIRALSLPWLGASLPVCLLAAGLAYLDQRRIDYILLAVALGAVASIQSAVFVLARYAAGSWKGNCLLPLPWSAEPPGPLDRNSLLAGGLVLIGLFIGCVVFLAVQGRPGIIMYALAALLLGLLTVAFPKRILDWGLAELLGFVTFGPLIAAGAYYTLTGRLSWRAFSLAAPFGLTAAGVVWINRLAVREAVSPGKPNEKRPVHRWVFYVLVLSALGYIVRLAFDPSLGWLMLLGLAPAPLALRALVRLKGDLTDLGPASSAQLNLVQTHALTALILAGALGLERFLRV